MKILRILAFLVIGVLLACDTNLDSLKVESCSPGNNAKGVAADDSIKITFNNEVNQGDIIKSFSLTSGSSTIEGTFNWVSTKSFDFIPRYDLDVSERYIIEIPREVRDKDGNRMESDFISDFYVGTDLTPPEVDSSIPVYTVGGTTGVAIDQDITIEFSESMDTMKTESAFSISPTVAGYYEWQTGLSGEPNSRLIYHLTADMEYGKQHTVTVSDTAEDLNGNSLKAEYNLVFITGTDFTPPTITGIYNDASGLTFWNTAQVNTNVDKSSTIFIYFSEAMDKNACESAFSVTPGVSGHFEWNGDTVMKFIPDSGFSSEATYQLRVETTAADAAGLKLENPYQVVIKTDANTSQFIKVNQAFGSYDNGTYTEFVNYAAELLNGALGINMGTYVDGSTTDRDYYVRLVFTNSNGDAVNMDQYSIMNNYYPIEYFGLSHNPAIVDIEWLNSNTVTFTLNGLCHTDDPLFTDPIYYRLKLIGGENGVVDENGNYLNEDFIFDFEQN